MTLLPDRSVAPVPVEKKSLAQLAPVEQNLKSVLETRTAGDPDDATIVFTDLSPARLSATMAKMGTPVCAEVIRHWMEEQDLRLRKIAKDLAGGHSPDRDTQFERIAASDRCSTKKLAIPIFRLTRKRKSIWASCFGPVECVALRRFTPSIMIFPVGPTAC